jgi:hypothetical protein
MKFKAEARNRLRPETTPHEPMADYARTRRAEDDLIDIWSYVA